MGTCRQANSVLSKPANSAICNGMRCFCFTIALICSFASVQAADNIQFLTHSLVNTYVDEAGNLRGQPHGGRRAFVVELMHAMMELRGQQHPIQEVPFKRGLLLTQTRDDYALFSVNRTTKREDSMQWVGPFLTTVTHFYKHKSNTTRYTDLDAARKVKAICVLNGNQHHSQLTDLGFGNLYTNNSYAKCIEMLVRQRVQLTPLSSQSPKLHKIKAQELKRTGIKLSESSGYLALSKNIPPEEVAQWQQALDKLKASGYYNELLDRFLKPAPEQ